VRFFYRADVQQKAKILRKVQFSMELDALEWCAPELAASLGPARAALQVARDAAALEQKTKKQRTAGAAVRRGAASRQPLRAAAAAAAPLAPPGRPLSRGRAASRRLLPRDAGGGPR